MHKTLTVTEKLKQGNTVPRSTYLLCTDTNQLKNYEWIPVIQPLSYASVLNSLAQFMTARSSSSAVSAYDTPDN